MYENQCMEESPNTVVDLLNDEIFSRKRVKRERSSSPKSSQGSQKGQSTSSQYSYLLDKSTRTSVSSVVSNSIPSLELCVPKNNQDNAANNCNND